MTSLARVLRNAEVLLFNGQVRSHFARWCTARMAGRSPRVVLADGTQLLTAGRFNDYMAIVRQHPTPEEIHFFRRYLPADSVFVDVGANIGAYSCLAWRTGRASRIVAFEPSSRYCAAWHLNADLNHLRHATLIQAAVAESGGSATFLLDPAQPLNNRIVSDSTAGPLVQVTTVSLDQTCATLGVDRIGFLKVDVEGAEPKVLRGATDLLSRRAVDVIYLELIIEFLERLGENPYEMVRTIHGHGYDLMAVLPDGSMGPRLDPDTVVDARRVSPDSPERDFAGLNVCAVPRAAAGARKSRA